MLANGHKLKIGGISMISQCIVSQQARIALDVGEEAARFDNPMLPLTRSEMALPLISRGRVMGAMTIQSDQPAAFTTDDITVLQSMADQISNAVESARLYEQAQAALQEVDAINRRLTGEAWESYLHSQLGEDVICVTDDSQAAPEVLLQVDDQLSAGAVTLEPDQERQGEAIATAPILLRGQPIGALRVRTPMDDWNKDLQAVLTDMAGHVAQAVENARLVEQTQRTASRERTINEINARVRQTIDLDTILQTAVNELGQTLRAARVVARVGITTAEDQTPASGNGRGEKND
jgi:GAF domain-containing protein